MVILTGRKKTSFSHFCISVIPYPIGTKFATDFPAIQGSLHTKFEGNHSSHFELPKFQFFFFVFFLRVFAHLQNCYKTQTRAPIALKFDTQKGSAKVNPSIKFGANPMNGSGVMTDYLRKTRSICCHAYKVNRFMECVENCYVAKWSNHRRSAFWWFERNRDEDHGDMTQNPTCVTITQSIFIN